MRWKERNVRNSKLWGWFDYFPNCSSRKEITSHLYKKTWLINGRYLLHTPWSRVLLEKLTGFQPLKKFPAFYGTRRFITAFASVCHLSLSWASSIHSMPPHPTSWRSSHLRLGLPSGSLSLSFPHQKPCMRLSSHSYALKAPPISLFSFLSPEKYWVRGTDY
jgi:hypothetical protein